MTKNTYIVSGSSSGIGRSITEMLLNKDHTVIGLARDHGKFQPDNENYIYHDVDFSKYDNLEPEFKNLQKSYPDIDGIICNAGFGDFKELEQFSASQMQIIMNVNFLSQALLVKTCLPTIKKSNQGKIIFIGSECALLGARKGSMYCASKFALRGFAQSLRTECSRANIAVSMINPGLVDTPFYDDLDFTPGNDPANAIQVQQVTDAIQLILNTDNNCVLEEINLQPMKKVVVKKL